MNPLIQALLAFDGKQIAPLKQGLVAADQYSHWEPKLHALQSVQHLDFELINREKVAAALPALSDDKKTLVKVWALDADVRIHIENESQLNRLQQKLNMALEAGPASLKARARQLKDEFKALD